MGYIEAYIRPNRLVSKIIKPLVSVHSNLWPPRNKVRKTMSESTANCVDIVLAIFLPPLGVLLKFGCQAEFWICLILTFFGYLPGIIYAVYAITK
ncbi:hypothetical protein RND81_05G136300 [Saponaria officinalis]|uniref:Uncharacterized protein n=1 Tax=Saponaria officinalis TaxID=3572 RepID=A0AAW1KVG3_SAPOF